MKTNCVLLSILNILLLTRAIPLDTGRYVIDSRPLHFVHEPDSDSRIHNSTIVLKKKEENRGPVYYQDKTEYILNNHDAPKDGGIVWRRPTVASFPVISNHRGSLPWKRPNAQMTSHYTDWTLGPTYFFKGNSTYMNPTPAVKETSTFSTNFQEFEKPVQEATKTSISTVINNHMSRKKPLNPHYPSFATAVVSSIPKHNVTTDVLGGRIKEPDTIKSTAIKVLDAPSHLKTTIKYNKIIVIQKRGDQSFNNATQFLESSHHTDETTKPPGMGNFSVAPVMDPWSNIPIPSRPAWVSQSQSQLQPVKGSGLTIKPVASPVVPNLPFMPFLSSLITPLLNRPLTPNAVSSGMQGIKAMQGFLRNSLMGAMFCFLPSAFIALSLSATQRAELRKMPEIDNMMIFCKKCLENLRDMKDFVPDQELTS